MICNVEDLFAMLRWLEENNIKPDLKGAGEITIAGKWHLIPSKGTTGTRFPMYLVLTHGCSSPLVAPWVVDELKRRATFPTR